MRRLMSDGCVNVFSPGVPPNKASFIDDLVVMLPQNVWDHLYSRYRWHSGTFALITMYTACLAPPFILRLPLSHSDSCTMDTLQISFHPVWLPSLDPMMRLCVVPLPAGTEAGRLSTTCTSATRARLSLRRCRSDANQSWTCLSG